MNDGVRNFLDQVYWGNSIENYLWFAGILLVGLLLRHYVTRFSSMLLFRLIKKYSGQASAQEFHDLLKKPFSWVLFLIVAYIAVSHLDFPESWETQPGEKWSPEIIVNIIYKIVLIGSITWVLMRVVDFFGLILVHRASKTESRLDDQLIPFFRDGLKIIVGILSFFFVLASVFEVNVVTLIGGLGIGGLAVALAAKETLENLLGSFTIFLDKPFTIGDHVKVGTIEGHVEHIGLRSTRIRTLDKNQVTVPNKKMVDAELENITERTLWRVKHHIGLLYSTDPKDLQNILDQIRKVIDNHEQIASDPLVRFDHFAASSLDIRVTYQVITNDFGIMMKVKEEINFMIIKIVKSNNTGFAYPSMSVYMDR
jgi:MscS family membrane protein